MMFTFSKKNNWSSPLGRFWCFAGVLFVWGFLWSAEAEPQESAPKVTIDWKNVIRVSKTIPTLQVVVNPSLRQGSLIHQRAWGVLRDLNADYVRFVPWLPYPRLGVAELEPPTADRTSWDFSLIDPLVSDFFDATSGHPVMLNFSTIPQWMFRTAAPVPFPADPNQVTWTYEQGRELVDLSGKQVAEYFARVAGWYGRADLPMKEASSMVRPFTTRSICGKY